MPKWCLLILAVISRAEQSIDDIRVAELLEAQLAAAQEKAARLREALERCRVHGDCLSEKASSSTAAGSQQLTPTKDVQGTRVNMAQVAPDVTATSHHQRRLSGGASQCGHGGCPDAEVVIDEDEHPYEALIFLFTAMIIGAIVTQVITNYRAFSGLQQTVVIFIIGMLYALIQESIKLNKGLGSFGRSYNMWMRIDPHLLLFTMLPALLAGDAMGTDTAIARAVANQCMFLAGPGVLIQAFSIGLLLWAYLPYDWPFLLCLTQGAILSATDPVAVVGMLKELGAPQMLTVQIGGESLLNDGTAIVLYMISYDMLKGVHYDPGDVIVFLVKTAVFACGLGFLLGHLFHSWIRQVGVNKSHQSSMIQISLTLCCAYWSYLLADGVFHISGVLCTVCSSLVLADKMWPTLVSKEAMETVWHTFEYIGNTVIFFLAGALAGHTMYYVHFLDYLHMIVIYIICMVVRGTFIVASRPVLARLATGKKRFTLADAAIMTWGGLRGAVGLALAIQVSIDRADCQVSAMDGRRVLFYTAGVAALTLMLNASTCPQLMRVVDIGRTDASSQRLMLNVYQNLKNLAKRRKLRPAVKVVLDEVLEDMLHRIMSSASPDALNGSAEERARNTMALEKARATMRSMSSQTNGNGMPMVGRATSSFRGMLRGSQFSIEEGKEGNGKQPGIVIHRKSLFVGNCMEMTVDSGVKLIRECVRLQQEVDSLDEKRLHLLSSNWKRHRLHHEEALFAAACTDDLNPAMMRVVNETFLTLVRTRYWEMIEKQWHLSDAAQFETLLASISFGMVHAWYRLADFEYLDEILTKAHDNCDGGIDHEEEKKELVKRTTRAVAKQKAFKEKDIANGHELGEGQLSDRETSSKRTMTPKFEKTKTAQMLGDTMKKYLPRSAAEDKENQSNLRRNLTRTVESTAFVLCMFTAVLLNAILILLGETVMRKDEAKAWWLVLEVMFLAIFMLEFVLKLGAYLLRYFEDMWNLFDFGLVCLGVVSLIMDIVLQMNQVSSAAPSSGEARLIRLARVFRVMRILRVFRLARLYMKLKAIIENRSLSLQLATTLRGVTILTAYVEAHAHSQHELMQFFCETSNIHSKEVARCIVESQIFLNKAVLKAVQEVDQINHAIINGMNVLRESNVAMDEMSHFVHETRERGILGGKEAALILYPLRDRMQLYSVELRENELGLMRELDCYRESQVTRTPTNKADAANLMRRISSGRLNMTDKEKKLSPVVEAAVDRFLNAKKKEPRKPEKDGSPATATPPAMPLPGSIGFDPPKPPTIAASDEGSENEEDESEESEESESSRSSNSTCD